MAKKERVHNLKITLPLIALCLPLFVKQYVTAENGCPYETYVRLDSKCIDISKERFNDMTEEIDISKAKEVNKEIVEVRKELKDLSAEIEDFCVEKQPETINQLKIMEDICQS